MISSDIFKIHLVSSTSSALKQLKQLSDELVRRGHHVRIYVHHDHTARIDCLCYGIFSKIEDFHLNVSKNDIVIYFDMANFEKLDTKCHQIYFCDDTVTHDQMLDCENLIFRSKFSHAWVSGQFLSRNCPETRWVIPWMLSPLASQTGISRGTRILFHEKPSEIMLGCLGNPEYDFVGSEETCIDTHILSGKLSCFIVNSSCLLFDTSHMIRCQQHGIPVIIWENIEGSEFINNGKTGFVVKNLRELVLAFNNIECIDSNDCIENTISRTPNNFMIQLESVFKTLVGVSTIPKHIRRLSLGKDPNGGSELQIYPGSDTIDRINGSFNSQTLDGLWANCSSGLFARCSFSQFVESSGVESICELFVGDITNITEELHRSTVKPRRIVFSAEQSSELLKSLGYVYKDGVFINYDVKIPIGIHISDRRSLKRMCRFLRRELSDDYNFEMISNRNDFHKFQRVLTDTKRTFTSNELNLLPAMVDLLSFPIAYHPKMINTLGFVGKPYVKSFGKMVGDRIEPSTIPNEGIRSDIFGEICRTTGLKFKYIFDKSDEIGFELYSGIDLLICTSDVEIGLASILEAAACGIGVISTAIVTTPEFPMIKTFRTVDECVNIIKDFSNNPLKFHEYINTVTSKIRDRYSTELVKESWKEHINATF